jgi:hypothetical protein
VIIFKKAIFEDISKEGVKWDDGKGNWLVIGLKLTDMFYYNLNNVYLRNNCCRMMIGGELRYSELITTARYQGLVIPAEVIRQIKRAMCYSKFAYYFYMFPSIYLPLPLIASLVKFKSILCKHKVFRKIIDYLNHINSRINRIILNKGNK